MICKRKRLFEKNKKRCHKRKQLKIITTNMIRNRKKKYYEKEVQKLTENDVHNVPYKTLKNIGDTEKPPAWNICHLSKGSPPELLAEEAANYFSHISQEFRPLSREDLPLSFDVLVQDLTVEQVSADIKSIKKPKSSVEIDPITRFVGKHSVKWAEALTPILNHVLRGGGWPQLWKEEEGSVIPKKSTPTNLSECRNISSTSIFSKLCETYMMKMLTTEVVLNSKQFGGVKGLGTVHMLAELVTDQMECLEDNRLAVVHMSIDLEKALEPYGPLTVCPQPLRAWSFKPNDLSCCQLLGEPEDENKISRPLLHFETDAGRRPPRDQEQKLPLLRRDRGLGTRLS